MYTLLNLIFYTIINFYIFFLKLSSCINIDTVNSWLIIEYAFYFLVIRWCFVVVY